MKRLLLAIISLLTLHPAWGQIPGLPAVTTAGTAWEQSPGRNWAVLSLRREDATLFSAPDISIWAKTGNAASTNAFAKVGELNRRGGANFYEPMFDIGRSLGDSLTTLQRDMDGLGMSAASGGLGIPAVAAAGTLGGKLHALVSAMATRPEMNGVLSSMALTYHSIGLALGTEWAGLMSAPTQTFEIREADGSVIGRVTVNAGAQPPLPAPGPPVQISETDSAGDLNIKLRWGTPDTLRRRSPMGRGFQLYRMPAATAAASNFTVTAPTPAQLEALVAGGTAVLVNTVPIYSSADLDETQAANLMHLPTVYYAADDGNRFIDTNGNGEPDFDTHRFNDGETFAYVVRGRDLMGRQGLPSRAGYGVACRRIPPAIPEGMRVNYKFRTPTDARPAPLPAGVELQTLELFWRPNVASPSFPGDVTTEYHIYRSFEQRLFRVFETPEWSTPQPATGMPPTVGEARSLPDGPDTDTEPDDPDLVLLGTVAHGPGDANGELSFEDTSFFTAQNQGRTVAYSVRAVRKTQPSLPTLPVCEVKSVLSGAVFGTLRNYRGPAAPIAYVDINCSFPAVRHKNYATNNVPPVPDQLRRYLQLICQRRDTRVLWAQFHIPASGPDPAVTVGPLYFGAGEMSVSVELPFDNHEDANKRTITCTVGTARGREAAFLSVAVAAYNTATAGQSLQSGWPSAGSRGVHTFEAAELNTAELDATDPLHATKLGPEVPVTFPRRQESLAANVFGFVALPDFAWMLVSTPGRLIGSGLVRPFGTVAFVDPEVEGVQALPDYFARQILVDFANANCFHSPTIRRPGDVRPANIPIHLFLTPRSREYRIYRSVDNGPLTMIAQGKGIYDSSPLAINEIIRQDDGVPPDACEAVYFGQVLDGDANGSPLVKIASIKLRGPLAPPTLGAIQPMGDALTPTAQVSWSNQSAATERFAVCFTPRTGPLPTNPVNTERVTGLARRYRLQGNDGSTVEVTSGARDMTNKIGSAALGAGPVFQLSYPVAVGVTYDVWLVGIGCTGDESEPSRVGTFVWRPEVPGPESLRWPLQPLPGEGVPFHPLMQLVRMSDGALIQPQMPLNGSQVGVRIGRIGVSKNNFTGTVGNYIFRPSGNRFEGFPDPNLYLFTMGEAPLRTALPCVLYRRQEVSASFPQVSGDVIQVTPKVEKIAFESVVSLGVPGASFKDPHVVPAAHPVEDNYVDLYLLDRRPAQRGAKYSYWLVRFQENGELDSTIDLGTIELP